MAKMPSGRRRVERGKPIGKAEETPSNPPGFLRETESGVTLSVRVTPRAGRDQVVGVEAGQLKIRLSAPPVEGAANESLVALLAGWLGVPRSQVALVRGGSSRQKVVSVTGRDAAHVLALLACDP